MYEQIKINVVKVKVKVEEMRENEKNVCKCK